MYETVYKEPATDEIISSMSPSERSKLITDNVVQTTIQFQKRIEKIVTKLIQPEFLESGANPDTSSQEHCNDESSNTETPKMQVDGEDDSNSNNPSYFYRIEFQARGAPHVHLLAWLKDKNGVPAPSLLSSTEEDI